jgi:hypothetical protein
MSPISALTEGSKRASRAKGRLVDPRTRRSACVAAATTSP